MQTFSEKIEEVKLHFINKDIHLGFRRLVDCVLETHNAQRYADCIALNEWKENREATEAAITEKCLAHLDDLKSTSISAPSTSDRLVAATDVQKEFSRGGFKLGAINFSIANGEVWGLVGENGNGKTTLLRILAKDLSFDSGTITYSSTFDSRSNYDQRTKLTYIPQRTPKWFGSLRMNLKYAATHYGIKGSDNELQVMMMIIRFGLYPFRNHNWSELSSGYKMRYELARTFLRKPKLLLLDEPLANLDIMAQQIVLEDLKFLAKSISNPLGIVLSSQQLFEVEKISDKIIFLKNGNPTLLNETIEGDAFKNRCMAELEIHSDRETLQACISQLKNHRVSYNGGQYIIEYESTDGLKPLLNLLLEKNISIKYIRDISASSRRLFN